MPNIRWLLQRCTSKRTDRLTVNTRNPNAVLRVNINRLEQRYHQTKETSGHSVACDAVSGDESATRDMGGMQTEPSTQGNV